MQKSKIAECHLFYQIMNRKILSVCLFIFSLSLTGCNKNQDYEFQSERDILSLGFGKKGDHYKWFYFTDQKIEEVERPDFSPVISRGPWTETIRISSANNVENVNKPKGYAIVNRLGILTFEGDKVTLSKDVGTFTDRTAGNLVFVNDTPVFQVYKSSFFNDSISAADYKKDDKNHLFLLQYDDNTQLSYPIVNCRNISDKEQAEITDFNWNGTEWNCSVKYIEDGKINFSYINWRPVSSLLSITPASAKSDIIAQETTVQKFRNSKNAMDFDNAPERVKSMLQGYGSKIPFTMELKNAGGASARIYQNSVSDSLKFERKCYGILAKEISSVLFDDGTLYLQGNLRGKPFFNDGGTIVLRLPKLPAGYVYGEYVITENTLFAAWEESSFYESGRSGFIAVNLERILYDN